MDLDIELQAVGTELIDEFGTSVQITSNSGEDSGSSSYTKGVITNISAQDLQDSYVTNTDKVIFIKGTLQTEPQEGDTIEVQSSGKSYTIIRVTYYRPRDIFNNTCAYRIIAR